MTAARTTHRHDDDKTPARIYAGAFGAVLLLVGLLGFAYNGAFNDNPADRDAVLGLFDVNGFHNLVHIASGLLGLLAFRAGNAASRTFALGFGLVYLAVAIWGFIIGDGDAILGIIPVNTEDNLLHTAIALTGLAAYAASPATSVSPRGSATA